MTPEQLIAEACPKIRDYGWAYYFVSATTERGKELGLDPLQWYFLGRGGGLGDVEASVARAAFGYFEPGLFQVMWDSAREVLDERTAGHEHYLCAANHGRRHLAGLDGLDTFCAAAERVVDAGDDTALPLYAAYRAEPLVEDLPGRAMQLLATLRELRGSAHLLALRAVGLDTLRAHAITRPDDLAMFGWTDDALPPIDESHRELRQRAEALTDEVVLPAYAALDADAQQALLGGLSKIEATLTRPRLG